MVTASLLPPCEILPSTPAVLRLLWTKVWDVPPLRLQVQFLLPDYIHSYPGRLERRGRDLAWFPQQLAASCSSGNTILESILPQISKPQNKVNPLLSGHKHKRIKGHLLSFLPIAQACSSWQPVLLTAHCIYVSFYQPPLAILCLFF